MDIELNLAQNNTSHHGEKFCYLLTYGTIDLKSHYLVVLYIDCRLRSYFSPLGFCLYRKLCSELYAKKKYCEYDSKMTVLEHLGQETKN